MSEHSHHARDAEIERLREEMGHLIRIGDRLQSEASRMAEHLLDEARGTDVRTGVPYEVHMAALGAKTAVDQWSGRRV